MSFLRNLKVKSKLLLILIVFTVVAITISWRGLSTSSLLNSEITDIIDTNVPRIEFANQITIALMSMQRVEKNAILAETEEETKRYIDRFEEYDKKFDEVTKWDKLKKHVLFAANPSREEKNFPLAKKAFDNMNYPNAELHFLSGISNELVPYYYNSSDVVLLTSLWEGSPNVIKEAMACNIPVVATDVGDIKTVIGGIEGCYVSPFDAAKLAIGLKNALVFSCRTRGRSSISHLNSASVAQELIRLYKNVLPLK